MVINIGVPEMAGPSQTMEEVQYDFSSEYHVMIEEIHHDRLLSNWYYYLNSMGRVCSLALHAYIIRIS